MVARVRPGLRLLSAAGGLAVSVLAGCAVPEETGTAATEPALPDPLPPDSYLGVQTQRFDAELVSFRVAVRGAPGPDAVTDYARCAAAQYSLIRGHTFARHVRTNVAEEAGIWRADAVYTISPSLPRGMRTIDAEVTVADCEERGIPTV
jgi:hypothetical protein